MFGMYGIYEDVFRALNYCTGGLAYTTLRFLITSCIVTIARYVDITTMQGTKNIVRKNIIFLILNRVLLMFLRNQLLKRINECWYLEKIFNAALENDSYFLV